MPTVIIKLKDFIIDPGSMVDRADYYKPRHPELLESVFDEDEILAMDAIDQVQKSLSI